MQKTPESLPKVVLTPVQIWRMVAVGVFVAFMVARVAPDAVRVVFPLGFFGYVTDDNGVVIEAPRRKPAKGTDRILVGDDVRIDRIKPFDRKPGLERVAYTRDNFDRRLPVDRNGKPRILHLTATPESIASRAVTLLRIVLFLIALAFGAILVIVKPRTATFAFFAYCLGGTEPTTFMDVLFDVPWREIPEWIGMTIQGAAPVGLLIFAISLAVENARVRQTAAVALVVVGLALGTLKAYADWLLTYAGRPAGAFANAYTVAESVVAALVAVAFVAAFVLARGADRQRTGWIMAAFALAGAARLASEHFFPQYLNFWQNGVLLSLSVVPAIVVWIAVVKHHFFDVDFVVSRALVYTAITAAVLGIIGSSEELLSYVFYNNTDLATGIVIALSLVIGSMFGKIKDFLDAAVDRFIFHERREQRRLLERLAVNLLDADTQETVWQALLYDVPSVLDLSFAGIMTRTPDGGFALTHRWQWPEDCIDALPPDHELTRDILRNRGAMPEDSVRATMIKSLFPQQRLTYAAPLYQDRGVSALVLYGHSLTGLDIDPEERTTLIRVMSNASIALGAIELAKYRAAAAALTPAPVQ